MVNLYLTLKQMYSDITDPRSQKYERSINESFDQFSIDRPIFEIMAQYLQCEFHSLKRLPPYEFKGIHRIIHLLRSFGIFR